MRKSLGNSHRNSCLVFAVAVFAALYSIGTLVYGTGPVVTQEYVAPPTNVATDSISDEPTVAVSTEQADRIDEESWAAQDNDHSADEEHAGDEPWPTDVQADMAGESAGETIKFDPDLPPVNADNENAEPTGEFADQILAGTAQASLFEGEAFGFDPNMAVPDNDNADAKPALEYADQIQQNDIENIAMLSGYTAHEESYIALQEVDESTAPPTETGASIDPEAHVYPVED